jgi:hypothetical protein
MKILAALLNEETDHFDPVPEDKEHAKIVRRYQVLLSLKIGANELFFRTKLNAKNKNDALEQANSLLHDNIKRMRTIGFEVVGQQAVLIHKERFVEGRRSSPTLKIPQ